MGLAATTMITSVTSVITYAEEMPVQVEMTEETEENGPEENEAETAGTEETGSEIPDEAEDAEMTVEITSEEESKESVEAAENEDPEEAAAGETGAAENTEITEETVETAAVDLSKETQNVFLGNLGTVNLAAVGSAGGASSADQKTAAEYVNATVQATLDEFFLSFPGGRIIAAPLKLLIGKAYGAEADISNRELKAQLDNIETQMAELRRYTNDNIRNSVVLGGYGGALDDLDSFAETLKTDIGDILDNDDLSDEKKLEKIALLYDGVKASNLTKGLQDASKILTGKTLLETEPRTLFEVVYDSMKNDKMFKGEVLDETAPYMEAVLNCYTNAYSVLDQIISAREAVEGQNCAKSTRRKMGQDFVGTIDEEGNQMTNGILHFFTDYFAQNRYTFINKGMDSVELSDEIGVYNCNKSYNDEDRSSAASFVRQQKLNADQIEALNNYVKSKGQNLYQYLTQVGFRFNDKTDTERYYYKNNEISELESLIRVKTAHYEKEKEIYTKQGIIDLPPVQEKMNQLLEEIEQHKADIERIQKEKAEYGFVDITVLAAQKVCYMLAGKGVSSETHYSGLSHSRHAYHDYYIRVANVMNQNSGVQRVRFGSTEDGPQLESMYLLAFK